VGVPPRHAPQTLVRFPFGRCDEGSGNLGPVLNHLAQSVDRSGAYVWVGMVSKEVERSRHPQILAGATLVLFAAIARQRVKGPSADAGILVVKSEDQFWQRFLVDELIEDPHALLPHDGLSMPETSAECRQRGWPRHQKVNPRPLTTG
jgi:hypothetical protein